MSLVSIRRAVWLAVVFAALQLSWQALRPTAVGRVLVEDITVGTAAAAVNVLTPSVAARADGVTVRAAGGGLRIINGCEGTELLFLLAAALAVAPLSWSVRMWGLVLGAPVVFVVNQLRILALFYANRDDRALFDLLHGTVTPIGVVVIVAGYFYVWLVSHTRVAQAS
jgi:exosortase/archaeosortase family protein